MKTELVVIGGGPGGYSAAFRAADLGKRVTMVESNSVLGGVCLNVGCIPSKTLLHLADVIDESRAVSQAGVVFESPVVDIDKVRKHKDGVVAKLNKGLAFLAKRRKVTVIHGTATFTGPHRIQVARLDGEADHFVDFDECVIAAGSRPVRPDVFPFSDSRVWDSTDALAVSNIPEHLLILGGGIIGLEMATVYQALGSRVTIIEMLSQLIPPADKDVVAPLAKRFKELGIRVLTNTRLDSLKALPKGLEAVFNDTTELFSHALIAVGRRSNADRLELQAAGLTMDERGHIPVDEHLRTAVPHIFAVGDITGDPQLAHKASYQGKIAAEVIAGHTSAFEPLTIPSVAYTKPEIAWCGVTETEAKEQHIDYTIGKFPFQASGRSLAQGNTLGFTKVLFEKDGGRIIGAAIVGPHAGELIAEPTLAVEMGADMEDIALTSHAHPTFSESVAIAAEVAANTSIET